MMTSIEKRFSMGVSVIIIAVVIWEKKIKISFDVDFYHSY